MKFKKLLSALIATTIISASFTMPIHAENTNVLAFPEAVGGGKYVTGARGDGSKAIEVYHVTSLNDSGQGTLRDAVSKGNRIVVFDVGGTINLESELRIRGDEKYRNLTILGQTAPGYGITITGYPINMEGAQNVIIRYLRVRPDDKKADEPDGIGGRWMKDIMIDHCSVSWSGDEALTLYGGSLQDKASKGDPTTNLTVSNCISAESLRMSNHIKGAHGYGAMIGATNATYYNNLFAHHDSRSPRFDRQIQGTDFVNNVIYDWGNNASYGAEPYSYDGAKGEYPELQLEKYVSRINIRNNYYKYGPMTKPSIRYMIFNPTNDTDVKDYDTKTPLMSKLYINGNYVYGSEEATNNNLANKNYVSNQDRFVKLDSPIDMGEYAVNAQSALDAYENTLEDVGASLPKRDGIDARVVDDVRNGTGRIINQSAEVGGIDSVFNTPVNRTFEIPSDWKNANGMGSAKETDIVPNGKYAGYTWLEAYVNDWTAQQSNPTNPHITVTSPAVSDITKTVDKDGKGFWEVTTEDKPVTYTATATPSGNTSIEKIELYDGTKLIKTVNSSSINEQVSLTAGVHNLLIKAYNNKGEITTSPTAIVYVTKNDGVTGDSVKTEVGTPSFDNKGNVWTENGKLYLGGSGVIGGTKDSFTYWQNEVTGDFSFSAKVEDIPKYENNVISGIMFRETLDENSKAVVISDSWRKGGEAIQIGKRTSTGGNMSFTKKLTATATAPLPPYMKIERNGNTLTVSTSTNGSSWNTQDTIDVSGWSKNAYIGLAVDGTNATTSESCPMLPWYTVASFSNIKMTGTQPYKITFNENNGSDVQDITYKYGDTNTFPKTEKAGYTFEGWYDNDKFSGNPVTAIPQYASGNLTYYAKMSKIDDPSSHTHSYVWKYNDTEHWKECPCGAVEEGSRKAHEYKEGVSTNPTCECGYSKTGTVTNFQIPYATYNKNYEYKIDVQGGTPPYKFEIASNQYSYPPGLTLSEDGVLSGVPLTAGITYSNILVKVTDSKGMVITKRLSLSVCKQSIDFTLKNTEVKYNGKAQAPQFIPMIDNKDASDKVKFTLELGSDKVQGITDSGTYNIDVTLLDERYRLGKILGSRFNIYRNDTVTTHFDRNIFQYDGKPKSPVLTVQYEPNADGNKDIFPSENYTVTYQSVDGHSYNSATPPTEKGEYRMNISLTDKARMNYEFRNFSSASWQFWIE